jgi:hypothetical protein
MTYRLIPLTFFLFVLSLISAPAQTADPKLKTFDQEGLVFSYPGDWTLTDRSSAETQHLMLSKPGPMILFVIVSPREQIVNSEQFWRMRTFINDKFFTAIERNFIGTGISAAEPENPCLDFNGRNIIGKRFKGLYRDQDSVGDVYPFAVGNRLLGLVYLRAEKDSAIGDGVWKDLVGSVHLAGSNKDAVGLNFNHELVDQGTLNGRALKLVSPGYPVMSGNVSGTIHVRVVVDEEGNVISAEAGPGNQYFRAYSEVAAKKSKFRPTTICGKGVRVTGVITYNFKYQSPCDQGVPKLRC